MDKGHKRTLTSTY
jgi:tubulin polyglutamylase TTLL6/13